MKSRPLPGERKIMLNIVAKLYSNLKHLLQTVLVDLIDRFARTRGPLRPNTLLLVCTDAIGDYILFRNFIPVLARSGIFSGYAVTLCGNAAFRDIAEGLDRRVVSDFIWIDRRRIRYNPFYRFRMVRRIGLRGFAAAIYPAYSRIYYWGDTVILASGAPERIGCRGDTTNMLPWQKRHADRFYTHLVDAVTENLFEFLRNREFCENYFGAATGVSRPEIERSLLPEGPAIAGAYVVFFPGAGARFRQWSPILFARVATHLVERRGLAVVLAGGPSDRPLAETIRGKVSSRSLIDLTGQTTLCGLAALIAGAKLLVANETGAVHLAAAVGTPFVCISNGNQLGRFCPYPREIFAGGHYLFPPVISEALCSGEDLGDTYRYRSDLNINEIDAEEVIKVVDKCLFP
jgi:ADP-heptose:LPS heptosyltransferase